MVLFDIWLVVRVCLKLPRQFHRRRKSKRITHRAKGVEDELLGHDTLKVCMAAFTTTTIAVTKSTKITANATAVANDTANPTVIVTDDITTITTYTITNTTISTITVFTS